MLKYRRIVRSTSQRIAEAALRTVDDLKSQLVEHEPDFTGKMLGRMAEAINGYERAGITWRAKILTSLATNSQERRFGADFLGVLHLDLPEDKVRKGFLVQAKRLEPKTRMPVREWDRMIDQCRTMLSISPHSYVFVYSTETIVVVPAAAIVAAQDRFSLYDFYPLKLRSFYERHFECFIGDLALSRADVDVLEALKARRSLLLHATTDQSNAQGEIVNPINHPSRTDSYV